MKSVAMKTAQVGKSVCLLASALTVLLFSVSLLAQANFGRILGTVTDQTGAVLAGAAVTVIDTERGIARSLVTDAAGEFNAPNLTPSTYTVRVQASGFKTLDRPNILLEVGKEIRVDLTIEPGQQGETGEPRVRDLHVGVHGKAQGSPDSASRRGQFPDFDEPEAGYDQCGSTARRHHPLL